MKWTGDEVRALRLRLGWDRPTLSRRLGLELTEFTFIESGERGVGCEIETRLENLRLHAEANARLLAREPRADVAMREGGLAQIPYSEINE